MKLKIYSLIIFLALAGSIWMFCLHLQKQKEAYALQCEKLAMDWLHEKGLDESNDVDFDIQSSRLFAEYYDLGNDGKEELVMAIQQHSMPKPDTNGQTTNYGGLQYFIFLPTRPIAVEKFLSGGMEDWDVRKSELLRSGKGLPNLLCVYDGLPDGPVLEGGADMMAHVFMLENGSMKEVLAYNYYFFEDNAPVAYTSQVSMGKDREIQVDYRIPQYKDNVNRVGEKQTRVNYDWNAKSEKYVLKRGQLEPSFGNFIKAGLK